MPGVRSLFGSLISMVVGIVLTRYFAEDGKILITNGITAFDTWLNPKSAGQKFQNVVDVQPKGEDVAVEFDLKGLLDFKYQHECKIYAELNASFYDEVIESIGENLDLDNKTIKRMKLAKHTKSAVEAITGYHHGRRGFFVWGQFRLDKRETGEFDLLIAVHKSSWKLAFPNPEAALEETKIVWDYIALEELHEGAEGGQPEEGKDRKNAIVRKFAEFSSKNAASISLKEKDQWLKYFQNDAHQALIDNCPDKKILNVLNANKEDKRQNK